jgi:hypothetical protein
MEVLVNAIKQENQVKNTWTGKFEIKLSLFTDKVIVHAENPKESAKQKINKHTKTLLKLSNYSKVAGYR